jgi:peptide/nickel transport system substrate-binding protein
MGLVCGRRFVAMLLVCVAAGRVGEAAAAGKSGELAWSLKTDPKSLDPDKVDNQAAEMVRYLTGGVLLRLNRHTLQIEPALASSWTISRDGLLVTFHLRPGLRFSDGSPLGASAVAASVKRVLDPATHAAVAAAFLVPQGVSVETPDPLTVKVHLAKRVVSVGKLFDEIAIEPVGGGTEGRITSGSFVVVEYARGQYLRLKRNQFYWKHDGSGAQLPYMASIRLDILPNRETDELRFTRGQYQMIDGLAAEDFRHVGETNPGSVHDLGPSLNTEQIWFNQSPTAPLPAWEKAWFTNRMFRVAVSQAIHRADLVRIAYDGHATPAKGFISPSNRDWYDSDLQLPPQNVQTSADTLARAGFRRSGAALLDAEGHAVKFSILTNAGNRSREKMAILIQRDLSALGMEVNIVTLDFPALIERLMHTQAYECVLLGLVSVDPDPSSMMNVWLSSSPNHQWNPSQKTPATEWEAEIDRQMGLLAATPDDKERKRALDKVQQIVADQQPFIYLVYPNMLYAVSPQLTGVDLTLLQPGIVSNIDWIRWQGEAH